MKIEISKMLLILVIIITVIFIGGIWYWALMPWPEITQPIDRTIDEMAEDKGIPIIEVKELKSEFVKGVGFGGAGGMGAAKIIAENPENFFEILEEEPIKIVVANDMSNDRYFLHRKYWGISKGISVITELSQTYYSPPLYEIKEITEETVIFQKNIFLTIFFTILGTIIPLYILYLALIKLINT